MVEFCRIKPEIFIHCYMALIHILSSLKSKSFLALVVFEPIILKSSLVCNVGLSLV